MIIRRIKMINEECVFVSKELADKIKSAKSDDTQLAVIQEYLDNAKKSMAGDLEGMEEDAIKFKGMLLSYKKAYKEALEAHCDAVYKMWEDIDGSLPNMKKKADKLVADLEVVFPKLDEILNKFSNIENIINRINMYSLKEMVDLVDKINNSSDSTKEVLLKVLSYSKEPNNEQV
jgi:hypothetical protein